MINQEPPAQGGTFGVTRIQGTDWADSGYSLDRTINVTTEFGLRTHGVILSYHKKDDGFAPMLILQFNFSWGLAGEGEWYNFAVRHGEQRLGFFPVQRMRKEPSTDFVCVDNEAFNDFLVWLMMGVDLVAEMHGSEDMACNFPIPADPNFVNALRRVRTRMVEGQ